MILRQLNNSFTSALADLYEKSEVSAIRDVIFQWAGILLNHIRMEPLKEIELPVQHKIERAILQLRSFTPVQYITSEAWFYNRKFFVSEDVLIPRPETEELVELVLEYLADFKDAAVIDIGTGSGCIPVTIKNNFKNTTVTAIDISEKALRIAKKNAASHQTLIDFQQLNFLEDTSWKGLPVYDVIISNPPYIPESEYRNMDKNVTKFEPHLALFVENEKPYIFYEKIADFAADHLSPHGKIFMEIHQGHGAAVAEIFVSAGFAAEIKQDISEKERIVIASRYR